MTAAEFLDSKFSTQGNLDAHIGASIWQWRDVAELMEEYGSMCRKEGHKEGFEAAREVPGYNNNEWQIFYTCKYPTYQDYLKTIQDNK